MRTLSAKSCQPYNSDAAPLSMEQCHIYMKEINSWNLLEDKPEIQREFRFKNYYQTMAFVNAVAWISHKEDHHPDMAVTYNKCLVQYTTHAVGGLSENDFICAAKVDLLLNGGEF